MHQQSKMTLSRRTLWLSVFTLAILLAAIGFKLSPTKGGMFLMMPGVVPALFLGWLVDRATRGRGPVNPQILVPCLTVLINAYVYYGIARLILWLAKRESGVSSAAGKKP